MSTLHVIFKVAGAEYAVAADEIFQMEAYTGATPIPGAPDYVAGLVQIRQQIVGVLDMRRKLGLPGVEPTPESRVVVLKRGERLIGFLVDSAREVLNIGKEQFREPPAVVANQSDGFVKALAQLKDRIIILLDTGKVIGEGLAHG